MYFRVRRKARALIAGILKWGEEMASATYPMFVEVPIRDSQFDVLYEPDRYSFKISGGLELDRFQNKGLLSFGAINPPFKEYEMASIKKGLVSASMSGKLAGLPMARLSVNVSYGSTDSFLPEKEFEVLGKMIFDRIVPENVDIHEGWFKVSFREPSKEREGTNALRSLDIFPYEADTHTYRPPELIALGEEYSALTARLDELAANDEFGDEFDVLDQRARELKQKIDDDPRREFYEIVAEVKARDFAKAIGVLNSLGPDVAVLSTAFYEYRPVGDLDREALIALAKSSGNITLS